MSLPLPERPTLAEGVVAAMRAGIRDKTFVPGAIYSVQQIADILGVSRSPVREGLLKLEEAGLIQFSRNRGFQVVLPTARDIAEIFGVRLSLEPVAARRVAERADAATLDRLRDTMALLTRVAGAGEESEYWRLDRELHTLVLAGAGNRRAAEIVDALRATTTLLRPPTSAGARALPQIAAEHAPIVEAVLAGDGQGAEAAMRAHLSETGLLLIAQLEGQPVGGARVQSTWRDVIGSLPTER